ncbi:MAG: protein kinase [bacterium]
MTSPPDRPDPRASLSLALGAAYIIDRELDVAGTSQIFVAHEESLDQDVAVVVVAEELTRNINVERFQAEMRRAGMLDEPHTVPVLSVGRTASGKHFYTMPFVRGLSLRQRIEQGPLSFDECVIVLRDVARAMVHAHGRGFVHRHLIPENVLLVKDSAAVMDFGLANALEQSGDHAPDALLTHTSLTALPYVAPEQAAAEPTDHRADIYAWGVMAYEVLLDADPFSEAITPALAAIVPVSDVPTLQLFKRHGVPEQLALLVMRCCEYDPADRPSSAAELVEVLERIPDHASTLALERKNAVRWVGAAIIAALALFVVSGMTVWRMQKRETTEAPLVAILPFDITGAPADSVLAQRLSNAVTAKLSKLAGLRVVDAASVRSIMDSTRSVRAIGEALGADFVLRSSMGWVSDAGGAPRLRVKPLVLRIGGNKSKWASGREVTSPADPFSMETALAMSSANALGVSLESKERKMLAEYGTRDSAAFWAYLRGDQLYRDNIKRSLSEYDQALREFEQAYRLDARYADALGGAALALARMAQAGALPTHYDSAVGLARDALAIHPGQAQALVAGATVAMAQERPDDARSWVDLAIEANPSNIEAIQLRAELLPLMGDSTGTWRDVEHLLALAPRSVHALTATADIAQTLRRFPDAAEFLQRARLLEPNRIDVILRVAKLGRAEGNFLKMARNIREFRKHGGQLSVDDMTMLRVGDDAMRREVAQSSPSTFHVVTRADSATYYSQKAQLFLARRDAATSRALLDSSGVLLRRLVSDSTRMASERRHDVDLLAWTDAARGERVRALAVATGVERDTVTLQWPNGRFAASIACNSAEIYAFVDDVNQMITQLRRCFRLPGGYAPNAISAEPALWRHAVDPRLRALLGEFNLEIRRKE